MTKLKILRPTARMAQGGFQTLLLSIAADAFPLRVTA
jgi:hypothetical protein